MAFGSHTAWLLASFEVLYLLSSEKWKQNHLLYLLPSYSEIIDRKNALKSLGCWQMGAISGIQWIPLSLDMTGW
jgi:hypothetical protein